MEQAKAEMPTSKPYTTHVLAWDMHAEEYLRAARPAKNDHWSSTDAQRQPNMSAKWYGGWQQARGLEASSDGKAKSQAMHTTRVNVEHA